jgi:hypothetical protein
MLTPLQVRHQSGVTMHDAFLTAMLFLWCNTISHALHKALRQRFGQQVHL